MFLPVKKRYCVFGCAELGAYMHGFPHPERRRELFLKWMSVVGDKLKGINEMKIYKNRKICAYHFTPDQKVASHRLISNAVPSLNLNGVLKSPGISVQLEHNYCFPVNAGISERALDANIDQPSTSQGHLTEVSQGRLYNYDQPSTSQTQGSKSSEAVYKKYKTSQKLVRKLRRQLNKSKRKESHFKVRLANATEMLKGSESLNRVTKNMTQSSRIFTGMQYRQGLKKPKGRRYTIEEKVLSLSIYKKSPKCYSLLSKYFKLPSAKALKMLLSDIKIKPGINLPIFEKLKDAVDSLKEEERLCTLILDEMSLTPQVHYNSSSDEIKGFSSNDTDLKIANHALVFMIKGIKINFKQPVAYYFNKTLKTSELKSLIKIVVHHVQQTGFKVICTVCDQGATNVSAINSLIKDTKEKYIKTGKEWRGDMFEVNGEKIIPIYDVPHLIKGIRNNLLSKDLIYKDPEDGKEKKVKWGYFEMLYAADKSRNELRFLHKLTEEHINVSKMKKMRVKMAAQLFSHSVAVTTDHLTARGLLSEECRQIISFVLLIDKLFDSLNAGTFNVPNGKIYRGGVRRNSPHHLLWRQSIEFLNNVKFVIKKKYGDKIRLTEKSVPSINNFIKTIEGVQAVWKLLNQKYSLDCMLTRNLNQDPIENFFGNIRSLGARNVSPNSNAFESAFKTLLLNNYSSYHAKNSNCEEDINTCLQTLDFFLKEKHSSKSLIDKSGESSNIEISERLFEALSTEPATDTSSDSQNHYVCGWVLTKCLKKIIKNCKVCRNILISNDLNEKNSYIQAKEYTTKKWLCYPSSLLVNSFSEIKEITVNFLRTNLRKTKLKEQIKMLIDSFVTFPCDCKEHKEKVYNYFIDTSINILIYSWCRSVNRILSGKITYTDNDDPIKISAQKYYISHKHKK